MNSRYLFNGCSTALRFHQGTKTAMSSSPPFPICRRTSSSGTSISIWANASFHAAAWSQLLCSKVPGWTRKTSILPTALRYIRRPALPLGVLLIGYRRDLLVHSKSEWSPPIARASSPQVRFAAGARAVFRWVPDIPRSRAGPGPAFSDFLAGSLPAATGRKMHFTGTTVLRIENGKIAEENSRGPICTQQAYTFCHLRMRYKLFLLPGRP
jgi:hypothetical protein